MNESIILRECSIHDKVEILGHVFHGLKEIESAVEISASPFLGDEINTELVDETTPDTPIQGVHVAEVWQSYPCFDFEDRMNEHRTYQNYFFSTKPFTPERLSEIYQKCNEQSDFALVNEDMPADLAPAVYYVGDYGKMVVATTAKGDDQRLINSQTIINLKNNLSDNTMSSQAHHKKYWVIGIIAAICIIAAIVIAHPHHAPSYKYKDGKPVLTVSAYGNVPVTPFLEISDDAYEFLYMDDIPEYQFQRKSNPAEYWLMNRMMQMFSQVTSGADTIWAWKYAVDESVAAYNRYIHRQIDGTAGRNMAMKEILDFSDFLNGGNTAEMTQGGYIASVVSLYQALDLYNNLIESTKDSRLRKLLFSEYYAWETYQEYDWDCIQEWKYSQEWYGDLPIEINWSFVHRMEDFQKSIKQDYDILVTHKDYAAKTKYSLEELTAQLSEARVPVDSTDINTLVPVYFDKWISARNELNAYLKGSLATSYQNATRDIIEEYLRSPDDDSDDDTYDL